MPQCLLDDHCTSFRSAGSIRLTMRFRPLRNTWAQGATRRRGLLQMSVIALADSGLGRGFTRYHDYIFPKLTALKLAVLVERTLKRVQFLSVFLDHRQDFIRTQPYIDRLFTNFLFDRKEAKLVNRELLGWLSTRPQPGRPFFAFLNYGDAHSPYHLPPGRLPRFGEARTKEGLYEFIEGWHMLPKTDLPPQAISLAIDAYDDCVADLDEQLGMLLDELLRRGVLDRTWLFITADHGESFGEHAGIFSHGTSLYQTELHVPLLIVPPGGRATKRVVKETVSLRDLAATIVEVVGLGSALRFRASPSRVFGTIVCQRDAALMQQ